jgi:hypothetical protein
LCRSRVALLASSSSDSPLARVHLPLSYDSVFRFRHARASRFGLSPSALLALVRRHVSRRARLARSLRLATALTRRSHGSRLGHPPAGKRNGQRPRSSSTNVSNPRFNVFKMGTHCPGTLRSVFPARHDGSQFTPLSQSRCPRPLHLGILPPGSFDSCPEHASSPTGPRWNAHERLRTVSAIGASTGVARVPCTPEAHTRSGNPPRSRPAEPCRMNGIGSVDGPKHLLLSSRSLHPYVWGSFGARGPRSKDRRARVSERRRKLLQCSFINRPQVLLQLRSRPEGRCSHPSEEAPPAGDRCEPWFAVSEVPISGFAEAQPSLCAPFYPAPTPSSSLRDHRGMGLLDIVRTDLGSHDPEATPARCLPPSTCARPEPFTRPVPRTVPEIPL